VRCRLIVSVVSRRLSIARRHNHLGGGCRGGRGAGNGAAMSPNALAAVGRAAVGRQPGVAARNRTSSARTVSPVTSARPLRRRVDR